VTGKHILLSAGGTGGHLFPAQALAQELIERGWTVDLATDLRAEKYVSDFPARKVHIVPSATFSGKDPRALMGTLWTLARGYLSSRKLLGQVKPDGVVGFGGYPTVPPLLAAAHKGLPTILHEQNAVMGRANRFLCGRVSAVATGFQQVKKAQANTVMTGNPLRQMVHEAAAIAYPLRTKYHPFNLTVFGGSQGARFFSQCIPEALALLGGDHQDRVRLTMQARGEDADAVRRKVEELKIRATVEEFFSDMPQRIAQSHLVVCRSGASSVSELALIGRPSILVPLPGALDDDQAANASLLHEAGGGRLVRQSELSPQMLAQLVVDAMDSPEALALQAESAKRTGVPDAAERLADLVEKHTG